MTVVSDRDGWTGLIAIAMLTNPGAAVGVVAPTIVDAFVRRGISLSMASLLGAAELAGLTVALLCSPLFLNRFDRRALAGIAVVMAISGQLLSLIFDAPHSLGALRVLAGLGEGGMYAVAIASLAATRSPDRAFGVVAILNQISATLLLVAIAHLNGSYPQSGAIAVMLGLVMLTSLFVTTLPRRVDAGSTGQNTGFDLKTPFALTPALFGLAGTFLLSCGFGAVWPFIGQIAVARNISDELIASAFSWVGAAGILAGVIVTALGLKLGRKLPLVFASVGFSVSLILPTYHVSFIALTLLLMFFWTFNIPYYMGLLAELDRTGRLAALTGAMLPFGIAAGQALSGRIAAADGFRAISFMGAGCVAAALAAMLIALRSRAKVQPDLAYLPEES